MDAIDQEIQDLRANWARKSEALEAEAKQREVKAKRAHLENLREELLSENSWSYCKGDHCLRAVLALDPFAIVRKQQEREKTVVGA